MSEELKPCPNPWCAGHQQLPAKGKAGWRVICACGVKTFAHDEMADAVAQWNTRPTLKDRDVVLEEIRRQLDKAYDGERGYFRARINTLSQYVDAALKERV